MRKVIAVTAAVAVVVGVGASSAFAGEITGKGKPTPIRAVAASECAYSGQNDEFVGGDASAPRTQTPAEGPPGAPAFGVQTPFGIAVCNPNGPVARK